MDNGNYKLDTSTPSGDGLEKKSPLRRPFALRSEPDPTLNEVLLPDQEKAFALGKHKPRGFGVTADGVLGGYGVFLVGLGVTAAGASLFTGVGAGLAGAAIVAETGRRFSQFFRNGHQHDEHLTTGGGRVQSRTLMERLKRKPSKPDLLQQHMDNIFPETGPYSDLLYMAQSALIDKKKACAWWERVEFPIRCRRNT